MVDDEGVPPGKRAKICHAPDTGGDVVTIDVKGGNVLQVHKSLLIKESPFAAAKFSANWDTNSPGMLSLKTFDERDVKIFTQWLYTGNVHTIGLPVTAKGYDPEWDLLIGLYLMGEYLQAARFCNDVMRALCHKSASAWVTVHGRVTWVYPKTTATSPLRKFLVDMHVHVGGGEWIKKELTGTDLRDPYRGDFLADCVAELVISRGKPLPPSGWQKFEGAWVQRYLVEEKSSASATGKASATVS